MARDMGSKDDAHPIKGGTVTNQSSGFASFVSGSSFPRISRKELVLFKNHIVAHNIISCPAQFMG
jgi:hypothetical protein